MRFGHATRRASLPGILAVASFAAAAQTAAPVHVAPSFTVAQAERGQRAYVQHCASCHGDVAGGRSAPPLRGVEFRDRWFGQPVEPLFRVTKTTMPPAASGTLGDDVYTDIVAYVLGQNGVIPGPVPLPSDPSALASMQLPWLLPRGGGEVPGGVTLPGLAARSSPLTRITPVTDAMLANPAGGDWLTWRRTWDSHGFSPLNQITKTNVNALQVKWIWSLPNGPNEATPLFHEGVLFVQSYGDKVQALDAVTGDLLWQYSRYPNTAEKSVKRNMALYADKLYVATSDTHVVALSVTTGKPIWDRQVALPAPSSAKDFVITGGPLVARGKVMVGTTGSGPGGNFIVGLDAATGAEAWRVYTIAQPGQPGGDSWNGVPPDRRSGASVWVAGSYDPTLNLAFFGIGQTYDTAPLRDRVNTPGVTNDALYTDSTVAINPDTGKMTWHFQHLPNDQWDLDWALEQLLVKLPGSQKTLLATSGKQAIYEAFEADTGRYLFSMDLGLQDVVTAIDAKTGAKTVDRSRTPGDGKTVTVCPHSAGAKSWTPESYNAATSTLFVPLNESCMDLVPVPAGGRGMLSTGVRWMLRPRPESDGKYGRLQAIDLQTRKVVWATRQRAPLTSGVLATAGGIVFVGSLDRMFAAFDDATGRELWRIRLNDVPNTAPVSFQVGGEQYIALSVGSGGGLATSFPMLLPELKNPRDISAALYVFALPDR